MSTARSWSLERLNRNRLYRLLGITLTSLTEGVCESELRPPDGACWPDDEQPHGGVLFTQMDTTMATAVLGYLAPGAGACSTIDLSIQYPAPAVGAPFTCSARVERRGNRVCFLRAETRAADGTLVALGQGSFRIFDRTG